MLRNRVSVLALSMLLTLTVRASGQQPPDTLSDLDLVIDSIPLGSDTSAALRHLGRPEKVVVAAEPNEDGILVTHWHYQTLSLDFDEQGHLILASWHSGPTATNRGLRIGATAEQVEATYGSPYNRNSTHIVYARSDDVGENRGILFILKGGRVQEILVGWVIAN
jgi:hypothetical protein